MKEISTYPYTLPKLHYNHSAGRQILLINMEILVCAKSAN